MLEFSVILPIPKGEPFQISSHLSENAAKLKILRIEGTFRRHPEKLKERFGEWFNPSKLTIRDNRPNMKVGHRHNHIFNVYRRIVFRSKAGRRVLDEDKARFVKVFLANICLMPGILNEILQKGRR